MTLGAGTKLGAYEILASLGAGGMGEVYRARDARLGRDVALKVLPAAVANDASRRARFEQEARSASALNHPNIITVYDLGTSEGVVYIVTELVEGESLRDLILRGPIPVRRLLDIGVQIADGLAAAHATGITHRDLKPENIMLTREGRVKILDFGLAKQTGLHTLPDGRTASLAQTQPGTVLGTVSYMSPEQARGAALDFHSDQFSFGLILYEAACGKKAFQKAESVQTLAAIISEEPPPLEVKIPAPLRWAIERCLAKEPRERYDSTRDLYHDLRNLRDHFSDIVTPDSGMAAVGAGLVPALGRSRRSPLRRLWRRALLWALAGASIALLAVFLLMQVFPRRQGPDVAKYRFTPLVTDVARAFSPAWSPDGKSFAYSGVVNGETHLYVRSLSSPLPTEITQALGGTVAFWSSDSSRVFYYKDYMSENTSLWSVAVAGGEPELVRQGLITATLSPDGKALAEVRTEGGVTSIWISSPLGASPHKYSPSPFEKKGFWFPALHFSPDGSKMLYFVLAQATGGNELSPEWWLIPYPEGGGRLPRRALEALSTRLFSESFSWMPDSRHVVAVMPIEDQQRSLHLRMADTQSDEFQLLTSGLSREGNPAVSPDGEKLIFEDEHLGFSIEEVPLNGGAPQPLSSTDQWEFDPAWSPVAQQLAYVTKRNGPQEIWLKSVQEGWSRPLVTPGEFSDSTAGFAVPVFSPDGSRIAYMRNTSPSANVGPRIWISSTSGGTPVRLTHETATVVESAPIWSPDGSWLAYTRYEAGNRSLVKYRLGSLNPPVVLKPKSGPFNAAWSPAGDWITFLSDSGDWLLISPDGKSERKLGPLKTEHLLWSRDGKTLYGIQPDKKQHRVLFSLDVASGRQKDVQDLGTEFYPRGYWLSSRRWSLAPDGKSFATPVQKIRSDLWMLEGFNSHRGWFWK